MEVDLREASLFSSYESESRTLSIRPNVKLQGSSEVEVTLTSKYGVKVVETFRIWVTFMNMAVYIPHIDEVEQNEDSVGPRYINAPPIAITITEISNTGQVQVAFDPPLATEVLD